MKISLIEFSVENFKIFKNKVTFSTNARKSEHTFKSNNENLLKTSLIYGPNASGKSTLLDALSIMRSMIITSHNNETNGKLPYYHFLLTDKNNKPITWEIIFALSGKIFKYDFSIKQNEIFTENLSEVLASGENKFHLKRKKQKIKLLNNFKKNKDIIEKTRKEVLFLSAASQWNNDFAINIINGIKDINIIKGQNSENYGKYTLKLFKENSKAQTKILSFLKEADFSIDDGSVEKVKIPRMLMEKVSNFVDNKNIPNEVDTINFLHPKFNGNNKNIGLAKINIGNESVGTQKFFDVLGPIIDTLESGKILLIDEFDNSLHPLLTKYIIDIFENNNPKNAQLIVTTHDTSLLSYKNFIKEQFWFTEKDKLGVGNLFSLAEFDLRNDTEFSKKYLEGRFGALPFIESL